MVGDVFLIWQQSVLSTSCAAPRHLDQNQHRHWQPKTVFVFVFCFVFVCVFICIFIQPWQPKIKSEIAQHWIENLSYHFTSIGVLAHILSMLSHLSISIFSWDDETFFLLHHKICTQLCSFLRRAGQHVLRISSRLAHFCFSMVKRLREAISCWKGRLIFFTCFQLASLASTWKGRPIFFTSASTSLAHLPPSYFHSASSFDCKKLPYGKKKTL